MSLGKDIPRVFGEHDNSKNDLLTIQSGTAKSACKDILKAELGNVTCLGHFLLPGFLDRKSHFQGMCPLSYLIDSLSHEVLLHGNIETN